MTTNGHNKHAKLAKPAFGNYGRHEWAIMGASCTAIKVFADNMISALYPKYRCAYADTVHTDEVNVLPGRLAAGALCDYTDQLNHSRINFHRPLSPFEARSLFSAADMVLVNGNHHQAKAQILIVDDNKIPSLQKRANQLNHVQLLLLGNNTVGLSDAFKQLVPNWQNIPLLRLDDTQGIVAFLTNLLQQATPPLRGLVLAGGRSQRMGFDKASVNWHGKEQQYFMADMLSDYCTEVYLSQRDDQQTSQANYNIIKDTFTGLGPFSGILSAFREHPDSAWLVVACDMPLIGTAALNALTTGRNTSTIATCFVNADNGLPEPLLTIWEPRSYPVMLSFLAQGYSCPRKVLINNDTALLPPPANGELTNVNTPEDFENIKIFIDKSNV